MKKVILFLKCFLFSFLLTNISGCNSFAAASYPYAERYELNYSEEQVKNAIQKFKTENPDFIVPKVTINNQESFALPDEQSVNPRHWYDVYFYNKKENIILSTWTRSSKKNKTIFTFVSINKGLNIGNWKDINNDFGSLENGRQKEKFEKEILNKIKEKLKTN